MHREKYAVRSVLARSCPGSFVSVRSFSPYLWADRPTQKLLPRPLSSSSAPAIDGKTWDIGIASIRLRNSADNAQEYPKGHRVNVTIASAPGVYVPTHLGTSDPYAAEALTIVQDHIRPDCSIHDIAGPLSEAIVARFPKSKRIKITHQAYLSKTLCTNGLIFADCVHAIDNLGVTIHSQTPRGHYDLRTVWKIVDAKRPEGKQVDITFKTTERASSPVHDVKDDVPRLDQESSLAWRHPTYLIHENIGNLTKAIVDGYTDSALFDLAWLAFQLGDEQSPCKRLTGVSLHFRATESRSESPTSKQPHAVFVMELSRAQYEQSQKSLADYAPQKGRQRAFVALGSNLGDRISMVEAACREMSGRGIEVIRTSALYETKPMYLEDQNHFVNGACEIATSLEPMALLEQLKAVEAKLGREKTIENGPRTIDLDILMYNNEMVDTERLVIPHKRMLEREFVLRPLCDLIPNNVPPTPRAVATFQDELDSLPESSDSLSPLTPLSSKLAPISSQNPARSTRLMAILNLTPDSFSDGGLHSRTASTTLISTLQPFVEQLNPITILDIGGQSTRPHAPQVSPEEELSRILPTIKLIRSDPIFQKLSISVDTYRASVAAATLEAGADIVNDVSAGQMDPAMLPTIAKLGCTCILMHMRGTPETMSKLTNYPDGVINGVGNELLARVRDAEKAGIRRWRIMLDPGIGFAKTQAQNVELLRRFAELRDFAGLRGFPWVVGASRKGFIGKITGVVDAKERTWGTAATVAAAIQGGADVVRVHDVTEMGQVAQMADAIWRA